MGEVSIANVINVSVSDAQTGIGEYNTSNLAIFTPDPYAVSFGSLGYKIYLDPSGVATDFGTNSQTYKQALKVFSQKPNILAGNGYLVVIPMTVEVQTITPSAAPASGTYVLNFGGDATAAIQWNATAADIQTAIRTLTGLEEATVTGTLATAVTVTFKGYYGNAALMTVTSNTLNGGITLAVAQATAGETWDEAIVRTEDLVQYFGLMATEVLPDQDILDAAAVVQPLRKIAFVVSNDEASVAPTTGVFSQLTLGNLTQTRGLFYGGTDEASLGMMAAYAGRALSTNFDGSNTTSTMHLKDLTGVQPDPTMDQTLLNLCQDAGADVYCSIQGVPKVFCSGANQFFDQIYNLLWFVGAIEVAGFNYLATTSTKIPQTENGMDGLKGAYRNVCRQANTNAYSAPGVWNDPTTFGNQQDFFDNIEQFGYYIYSLPIGLQSQADRADRDAPLVQIALKEAGAIHKSNVIIYVNP